MRQKRGFIFVYAELARDACRHALIVAREHDRLAAHARERADHFFCLRLYPIADDHASDINSVFRHIDDRPRFLFDGYFNALSFHEFFVAAGDPHALFFRDNALAREIRERKPLFYIPAIASGYRTRYRMRRVALRDRGEAQNALPIRLRLHGGDDKVAPGERPRLVKDENARLVEFFQIIRSFDENAVTRRRADTGKEGKRNGDDERAGTGDDQKAERPIYPRRPLSRHGAGHDREQNRNGNHRRSIIFSEFTYEVLRFRLLRRGVFHEFEDLRDRGIIKFSLHSHVYLRSHVHAPADDLIPLFDLARQRFSRERAGIQSRRALDNDAVERDFFARIYANDVALDRFGGINAYYLSAP